MGLYAHRDLPLEINGRGRGLFPIVGVRYIDAYAQFRFGKLALKVQIFTLWAIVII